MPMGLCWAKHHRVWATLAFIGADNGLFGILQDRQLMCFEHFDTDLAAERNVKKLVIIIQICLKEVIGNKLLLRATAMVNCGEALWATHLKEKTARGQMEIKIVSALGQKEGLGDIIWFSRVIL